MYEMHGFLVLINCLLSRLLMLRLPGDSKIIKTAVEINAGGGVVHISLVVGSRRILNEEDVLIVGTCSD